MSHLHRSWKAFKPNSISAKRYASPDSRGSSQQYRTINDMLEIAGRIAVFSVRVLRDERICIVAEQKPGVSEEDSFSVWLHPLIFRYEFHQELKFFQFSVFDKCGTLFPGHIRGILVSCLSVEVLEYSNPCFTVRLMIAFSQQPSYVGNASVSQISYLRRRIVSFEKKVIVAVSAILSFIIIVSAYMLGTEGMKVIWRHKNGI